MKTSSCWWKKIVPMLIVIALMIAAYVYVKPRAPVTPIKIAGMYLPTPEPMISFALTDNKGKPFTKASLQGHWTLLFFGFTNCGMVCPTTMAALNTMYESLQKELPAEKIPAVVMVSVDPERDSVERMDSYVNAFNPHFIGARGGMSQITALEKALHLVSVKLKADNQAYTINHSAEIMVVNPQGQLQAFFSYPHEAAQMVKDYKAVVVR